MGVTNGWASWTSSWQYEEIGDDCSGTYNLKRSNYALQRANMIRQESLRICDLIATVETGPHQRPQSVEVVPVTCDFDATVRTGAHRHLRAVDVLPAVAPLGSPTCAKTLRL